MTGQVGGVAKGCLHLVGIERELFSDGGKRLTPSDGAHDTRDVHTGAGYARLPEAYVRIHGDAGEDLHPHSLRTRPPETKEPLLSQGLLGWGVVGLNH